MSSGGARCEALGSVATEKVLEHIANSKPLPVGSGDHKQKGQQKKLKHAN